MARIILQVVIKHEQNYFPWKNVPRYLTVIYAARKDRLQHEEYMHHSQKITFVLILTASIGWAENWPAWRGPDNNGISKEKNLPFKWSKSSNIRWKLPLPEAGNSTPIIWNDRVFLTQSLDKGKRRAV